MEALQTSWMNTLKQKNEELEKLDPQNVNQILEEYRNRINAVLTYVERNFPYGFRHAQNPQTKRSVFEAISVGVWKALADGTIQDSLDKEHIKQCLSTPEFKQYTHVANELHKKQKLQGRVLYIYRLVSGMEADHAEH